MQVEINCFDGLSNNSCHKAAGQKYFKDHIRQSPFYLLQF